MPEQRRATFIYNIDEKIHMVKKTIQKLAQKRKFCWMKKKSAYQWKFVQNNENEEMKNFNTIKEKNMFEKEKLLNNEKVQTWNKMNIILQKWLEV